MNSGSFPRHGLRRIVVTTILAAIVVVAAMRMTYQHPVRTPEAVPIRVLPMRIEPTRRISQAVIDPIVVKCFCRLVPPEGLTRTGSLHALRLFGARRLRNSAWSGERVLADLRNENGKSMWREAVANRFGVFIPYSADEAVRHARGSEAIDPHRNKTLSVFALCSVPATETVQVSDGRYFVRDMLRGAMNESRLQHGSELPWTLIGLSGYLVSDQSWTNRHGETISLENLALALVESSPRDAACLGTHTPFAVTFVLRLHKQSPVLSAHGCAALEGYLQRTIDSLRVTQRSNGAWGKDWTTESAVTPGVVDAPIDVLATGHHLEWLSLLPDHLSPAPDMIQRAAAFLVSTIQDAKQGALEKNYTVYSHAGCALRNLFATEWRVALKLIEETESE